MADDDEAVFKLYSLRRHNASGRLGFDFSESNLARKVRHFANTYEDKRRRVGAVMI